MRISPEKLTNDAASTGFRADVLEKVARLTGLLSAIREHPHLKGRLVLKGGTALNLFVFDVPRLSVDIDLNYIGATEKGDMEADRLRVEEALQAVFSREDFTIRRMPAEEHAGGKWSLNYVNAYGGPGSLEVDLNYMLRTPLWPTQVMDSRPVGSWVARGISVLDIHELAAGKLAALLSRKRARDLFDACQIFGMSGLDLVRLRLGFVVYGAMNRRDWREVSAEDVDFDPKELANQLVPTLRNRQPGRANKPAEIGVRLLEDCRKGLSWLLPFTDGERTFLDRILDKGRIEPEHLTNDPEMVRIILNHPSLKWKALNVRKHRGLSGSES
mgnify:CR=1 FL=1